MVRLLAILALVTSVLVACSSQHSTTKPSGAYDRQEAALHDPFGYSPDIDKQGVSGGKTQQYDKNAMRKDLDHVLNP